MIFRARQFEFRFPRPVVVMGVLNVTPDSFSDGGRFLHPDAAVARAIELVAQGAEIVDVGGESTRPYAHPVTTAEELRRVLPVIERLAPMLRVPISIDTQKPAVAEAALAAGASLVNDVAANREDATMARVVAAAGAGYVCMHMQGTPQDMQRAPRYDAVRGEVESFFEHQLRRLAAVGLAAEQVILDVGIGFGKTAEHNLQLLGGLERFKRLQRPLLLGVSRKSFIGSVLGVEAPGRLAGTLACSCWAALHGVHILRAHDVAETIQVIRMLDAIRAHAD